MSEGKIVFELENQSAIRFTVNDFIKLNFREVEIVGENEYFAKKIKMIIRASANLASNFDNPYYDKPDLDLFNELIKFPNIMEIIYQNEDTKFTVYPDYNDISYDKYGTNTFQIGKIDKKGNLIISIKERRFFCE